MARGKMDRANLPGANWFKGLKIAKHEKVQKNLVVERLHNTRIYLKVQVSPLRYARFNGLFRFH